MSKKSNMSLGDIQRATQQTTPYQDLKEIVEHQQKFIAATIGVAGMAHTMGLSPDHPVTNMCYVLTNDLTNFKSRLDVLISRIRPDIPPHAALPIGSELLTLQEDMQRVMLPIIKDIEEQSGKQA